MARKRSVYALGQILFIDNGHAVGRLEVKYRFRQRHVLFPIPESEFRFDVSRLAYHDACEFRRRANLEACCTFESFDL